MTADRPLTDRTDPVGPWRMHAACSPGPPASTAPAVVLVHGLGMSSRYLLPTLALMARHHDVFAPDLPGCGRSTRPDRPLRPAELADALLGWMDVVGLDRPVLVGHSIGSQVIVHLAERHPDRASSLVLASPTGDPAARRWGQSLRLLADTAREVPGLVPVATRDYLRAGPLRMWRTLGLSIEVDTVERLRRLSHRSLVVRGADDHVVTACWAGTVAEALGAERSVTIPDAPHGLPYSAALQLVGAIEPFLEPAA